MTNKKYRSRFNRHIEEQSKRNIIFAIFGVILVIGILIKFGVPILIDLSLFLSGTKKQDQVISQEQNQITYIAPPILNDTFSATNSAHISVSGNSTKKYTIKLYRNNELVSTQDSNTDGSFIFRNVSLQDGENTFKSQATDNVKISDFSNELTITFAKSGPKLTVDSPNSDMQTKDNHFTISGSTDPSATVAVNDHQAILDSNGHFSYSMILQNGDNTIKVSATDEAGNHSDVTHKVTYNP